MLFCMQILKSIPLWECVDHKIMFADKFLEYSSTSDTRIPITCKIPAIPGLTWVHIIPFNIPTYLGTLVGDPQATIKHAQTHIEMLHTTSITAFTYKAVHSKPTNHPFTSIFLINIPIITRD